MFCAFLVFFLGGWVQGVGPPPPPHHVGVGHFWLGGSARNSGWVGLPINPPARAWSKPGLCGPYRAAPLLTRRAPLGVLAHNQHPRFVVARKSWGN